MSLKTVAAFFICLVCLLSLRINDKVYADEITKEMIDAKSKSWKKSHEIDDFDWFKEHVIIKGMTKEKVIAYLGAPIENQQVKDIENSEARELLIYKKIDVEKSEYYFCCVSIDKDGKVVDIWSKGYK